MISSGVVGVLGDFSSSAVNIGRIYTQTLTRRHCKRLITHFYATNSHRKLTIALGVQVVSRRRMIINLRVDSLRFTIAAEHFVHLPAREKAV